MAAEIQAKDAELDAMRALAPLSHSHHEPAYAGSGGNPANGTANGAASGAANGTASCTANGAANGTASGTASGAANGDNTGMVHALELEVGTVQ